jgi:hypothetical protein
LLRADFRRRDEELRAGPGETRKPVAEWLEDLSEWRYGRGIRGGLDLGCRAGGTAGDGEIDVTAKVLLGWAAARMSGALSFSRRYMGSPKSAPAPRRPR